MSKPIYRPPSVWITQVLLVLTLINGVVVLAFMFSFCSLKSLNCQSPLTINVFLIYFPTLAIIFLAFWGLQKRRRYGKWLAVSLLISSMAGMLTKSDPIQLIYRSITQWQLLPAPPYQCWKGELGSSIEYSCGYDSYLELMLRGISDILPALFPGFLAMRLLYSMDVKRFLHR